MESGKRVLVTFSSRGWEANAARFVRQASAMNSFSQILAMSESDLKAEGWPCAHRSPKERGYGYWTWKSVACLRAIREAGMDVSDSTRDVLIWADAGCTFVPTPAALEKLQSFFSRTRMHPSGWLAFEQTRLLERAWTKGDVFEALGAHHLSTKPQVWAGCFFVRPTPHNVRLLQSWRTLCELPHLVDDTASSHPNFRAFREHRHDQSLLSVLLRLHAVQIVPDECETVRALLTLRTRALPILSTRIRRDCKGPLGCVPLTVEQVQMLVAATYVALLVGLVYALRPRSR